MSPRVSLLAAEYWQLRARIRDVEAVELENLRAQLEGQQRLKAAKAACASYLRTLTDKYGFPADARFGWNDETRELIVQTDPPP